MKRRDKTMIARELRRHSTPSERRMWQLVRNRRMLGLKFKRQFVIRGFVVDFYCHALRVAIELDGGIHDTPDQRASDDERSAVLEGLGVRILRLANEEVTGGRITDLLTPLLPATDTTLPSPAPRERGRG